MSKYFGQILIAVLILVVAGISIYVMTLPQERVPVAEKPMQIQKPFQPPVVQERPQSSVPAVEQPSVEQPTQIPSPATTARVEIRDFEFMPKSVTIAAGSTVVWEYPAGKNEHVVHIKTKDGASYNIQGERLSAGGSWSYTFETPGEYFYIDAIFPFMQGYVIVLKIL